MGIERVLVERKLKKKMWIVKVSWRERNIKQCEEKKKTWTCVTQYKNRFNRNQWWVKKSNKNTKFNQSYKMQTLY